MSSVDFMVEFDKKYPKCAGTAEPEKLLLYSLLRHMKPKTVLEIGVSAGHMTCWLALAMLKNGEGKVTSVDNFSRAHGGEADTPEIPKSRLRKAGLLQWVDFVKSDSVEYLKAQADNSYDFVWVDADHSYDGAYEDIIEALRVAKKGVGVHDVCQIYDGPREAVKTIEKERGIKGVTVPGFRGSWFYML